ncbi:MAG: transcriptional regulator MntR [bacterium]|nr:transcriptional regulator MntR [bacterium]
MKNLSEPNEDYLERIFELFREKGYARVSDMAERLEIKPASVTHMIQKLEQAGYVQREPYRGFTLTKLGLKVGGKVNQRHQVLQDFLTLLKISPVAMQHDIEGLEHHLSDETLKALQVLVKNLTGSNKVS